MRPVLRRHAQMPAHEESAMTLVEAFEAGQIDNRTFHHAEHVRVAFELLAASPFETALTRFATGLRRMAGAAGAPEKFHMTITVAFFAAIAERRAMAPGANWEEFV